MKPFVLVDVDTMELILVIQNTVKRVKLSEIDDYENFIDEFYRRFKDMNFVAKYNSINRKEFMGLIDGLKKKSSEVSESKQEMSEAEIDIISKRSGVPKENIERSKNVKSENTQSAPLPGELTVIRSNTERKIAIDDLQMRFDEPYDYYDLSLYDQERVKKSSQLKYFLDKGFIVRTTLDEVSQLRGKMIASKEDLKKKRQSSLIVNRKDVMGDDDEMLISSDQYRAADSNMTETRHIDVDASDAASAVFEMFSGKTAVEGEGARSIDDLLRKT